MGQYFVGNVFSLESPPAKEISQVDIAIASQGANTPVNLLLHMDTVDLSEDSKSRIKIAIHEDILSTVTVKQNLAYSPETQYNLANYLKDNLETLTESFNWKSFPTNDQLREICILIFHFLEGSRLKNFNILSGIDLDRHVKMLMMSEGVDGYLKARIENESSGGDISDIIENSLKIVRNVFCFSFPRALRSLDNIQKEVLSKNGIDNVGDFNNYASNVENLKMEPDLFALNEFGIPLQTIEKIKDRFVNAADLDQCLIILQKLDYANFDLLKFERDIIDNFKKDHIGG